MSTCVPISPNFDDPVEYLAPPTYLLSAPTETPRPQPRDRTQTVVVVRFVVSDCCTAVGLEPASWRANDGHLRDGGANA